VKVTAVITAVVGEDAVAVVVGIVAVAVAAIGPRITMFVCRRLCRLFFVMALSNSN
jgi:hypothetical protein